MKTHLSNISKRLFGQRYYAVIVGEAGSDRYDIASQIHTTRASAEAHRQRIMQTRSYVYITTVKFRSRHLLRGMLNIERPKTF